MAGVWTGDADDPPGDHPRPRSKPRPSWVMVGSSNVAACPIPSPVAALHRRNEMHERKTCMSSTTETNQPLVGNGAGASAPAMVQEEELVGLPRNTVPEHGAGTKVAYDLMTNELLLDGSARLD